jgi:hypothetical protein
MRSLELNAAAVTPCTPPCHVRVYLCLQVRFRCEVHTLHCLFCAVCLQVHFPAVKFSVLNLARGAVDVTPASMCWYQYVPEVCYNVFQKCLSSWTSLLNISSLLIFGCL